MVMPDMGKRDKNQSFKMAKKTLYHLYFRVYLLNQQEMAQ